MPKGERDPTASTLDRRALGDRRSVTEISIVRILGAQAGHGELVEVHAVGGQGRPIRLRLPAEAAMTLLNDLSRLAREDGWFIAGPTSSK